LTAKFIASYSIFSATSIESFVFHRTPCRVFRENP